MTEKTPEPRLVKDPHATQPAEAYLKTYGVTLEALEDAIVKHQTETGQYPIMLTLCCPFERILGITVVAASNIPGGTFELASKLGRTRHLVPGELHDS